MLADAGEDSKTNLIRETGNRHQEAVLWIGRHSKRSSLALTNIS